MASKDNWLKHSVEQHITASIARIRSSHGLADSGVKIEDNDRYICTDDGSNFRIAMVLGDTQAGTSKPVYILKITSISSDCCQVVIGDTAAKIRVELSADATSQLEAGVGEKLAADMTGDVFRILKADLVCTPFGFSSQRVRLEILDLEYLHHVRRPPTGQVAISDEPTMAVLILDLVSIRQQRHAGIESGRSVKVIDDEKSETTNNKSDGDDEEFTDTQWPESPPVANDIALPTLDAAARSGNLPRDQQYGSSTSRVPRESALAMSLNFSRPTATDLREAQARNAETNHSQMNYRRELLISRDQRAVLDQKGSWRPPLPGAVFPSPNVPVKVLASWNARAHEEERAQSPTERKTVIDISDSSSDVEDSTAESRFKRADLPPDSSIVPASSPPVPIRGLGQRLVVDFDKQETPKSSAVPRVLLADNEQAQVDNTNKQTASPKLMHPDMEGEITEPGIYRNSLRKRHRCNGVISQTVFTSFAHAFIESTPGGAFANSTTSDDVSLFVDAIAWKI